MDIHKTVNDGDIFRTPLSVIQPHRCRKTFHRADTQYYWKLHLDHKVWAERIAGIFITPEMMPKTRSEARIAKAPTGCRTGT